MTRVCENNRRECDKLYNFSTDGIFLWTKETCIGDEIFYSFLEARGLHEEFLSSFCKERTEQYRYCCRESASFLSEDTFITCFFAWIANWDIDFRARSSIDPFCGHNPEVLACDGVHVGVAVRFMAKTTPITKSEIREIKPIGKRRFDRVLLPGNTEAAKTRRNYVRNYCKYGILKEKKVTGDGDESSIESDEEDCGFRQVNEYEDKLLEDLEDTRLKTFLSRVFLKQYNDRLLKKCARLLLAFTSGAALISFFPWSDIKKLEEVFNLIKTDKYNRHDHLDQLESFRVQYADITECACRFYVEDEIADFFLYLLETTRIMHINKLSRPNPSQSQQPDHTHSFEGQQLQQPCQSQISDSQQQQQQAQDQSRIIDSQPQQQHQPCQSQIPDRQQQQQQQEILDYEQQHAPSEPEQILSPFDPTTGISYYFTAHGGQVRQTPTYSMDGMYMLCIHCTPKTHKFH